MENKKLLENGVINFFYKKEQYRSLSNFSEYDVIINDVIKDRVYESGEHCFHGEKYTQLGNLCKDENRKKMLLEYGNKFIKPCLYKKGADVKRMGGKHATLLLNKKEINLWYEISIDVQQKICKYKYDTYKEIKNDLLKSKDKILVHPALRCSEENLKNKIWEGKGIIVDGNIVILGQNRLGNIWMNIRNFIFLKN